MDVLLLKPVEKLGAEGTVVRVKPGYARNYLLPRGWAVLATPEQLRAVEQHQRQQVAKDQRIKTAAEALRQRMEQRSLSLKLTVGTDEKAFGSISAHDIVDALKADGIELEKHLVHLDEPLKSLGMFELPVRLHPDVVATLKIRVVKA